MLRAACSIALQRQDLETESTGNAWVSENVQKAFPCMLDQLTGLTNILCHATLYCYWGTATEISLYRHQNLLQSWLSTKSASCCAFAQSCMKLLIEARAKKNRTVQKEVTSALQQRPWCTVLVERTPIYELWSQCTVTTKSLQKYAFHHFRSRFVNSLFIWMVSSVTKQIEWIDDITVGTHTWTR